MQFVLPVCSSTCVCTDVYKYVFMLILSLNTCVRGGGGVIGGGSGVIGVGWGDRGREWGDRGGVG